jgi:hypothetical protein
VAISFIAWSPLHMDVMGVVLASAPAVARRNAMQRA